jgi:hypothetical protein
MNELSRVLKPGGYILLSTHGESYSDRLNEGERRQFASGRLVVKNDVKAPGTNMCAAYHPPEYVREELGRGLELVEHVPQGAKGNPHQDLYVLCKP